VRLHQDLRSPVVEVLLAHYSRGTGMTGVHCECGLVFCCSVTHAAHQAEQLLAAHVAALVAQS
jgi:hypothetical protein